LTALAQIAAEELDVSIDRIVMISGDTARTPDEGFTSGSRSIEQSGMALRYACAEARDLLIKLAGQRLKWSYDELTVQNGVIYAPGTKKVTYGELAAQADLRRKATAQVRPKPAGARKIAGKSVARRDIPGKVTGVATYVQDIRLPGMLHGRIARAFFRCAVISRARSGSMRTRSVVFTAKVLAATAIMAPTMPRSMQPSSHALRRAGRCACNGCVMMSSRGSRMGPPWQ